MTDSVRQAQIEILRYLLAHQTARDTIEGIEKWWLPQDRQYSIADVATALQSLASHSLIHIWKSASAKPVYGCGPAEPSLLEDYLRSLE